MTNREQLNPQLIPILILTQCAWPIVAVVIHAGYGSNVDSCDVDIERWSITFSLLLLVLHLLMMHERYHNIRGNFYSIYWLTATLGLWIAACIFYAKANETHRCEKVIPHLYHFMEAFVFAVPIMITILCVVCGIYHSIHIIQSSDMNISHRLVID